MKKSIYSVMVGVVVLSAFAAYAESLTGFVFSENNGKYWRIGKKGGNGENLAVAIIPVDEAAKVSGLEGKTIRVTGELDPSSTFPKFKPGFTVEEVTE